MKRSALPLVRGVYGRVRMWRNASPPQPQMSQGLISMASHTTSPANVDRK